MGKIWESFWEDFTGSLKTSAFDMLKEMGNGLVSQVTDLAQELFVDPLVTAFKDDLINPLVSGIKSTLKGLFADLMPDLAEWVGIKKTGSSGGGILGGITKFISGIFGSDNTGALWDIYDQISETEGVTSIAADWAGITAQIEEGAGSIDWTSIGGSAASGAIAGK